MDAEWPDSSARTWSSGKLRPDGRDDGLLRQVVGLGHHVLGALLDDVLEALVVLDLDGRSGAGRLDGDRELGGVGGRG